MTLDGKSRPSLVEPHCGGAGDLADERDEFLGSAALGPSCGLGRRRIKSDSKPAILMKTLSQGWARLRGVRQIGFFVYPAPCPAIYGRHDLNGKYFPSEMLLQLQPVEFSERVCQSLISTIHLCQWI